MLLQCNETWRILIFVVSLCDLIVPVTKKRVTNTPCSYNLTWAVDSSFRMCLLISELESAPGAQGSKRAWSPR